MLLRKPMLLFRTGSSCQGSCQGSCLRVLLWQMGSRSEWWWCGRRRWSCGSSICLLGYSADPGRARRTRTKFLLLLLLLLLFCNNLANAGDFPFSFIHNNIFTIATIIIIITTIIVITVTAIILVLLLLQQQQQKQQQPLQLPRRVGRNRTKIVDYTNCVIGGGGGGCV